MYKPAFINFSVDFLRYLENGQLSEIVMAIYDFLTDMCYNILFFLQLWQVLKQQIPFKYA